MCGIAGIVDYGNNNSSVSGELLKSMSDVITHRGPDSEGRWISEDRMCGLAFRRLSIIDLSDAGNQPMSTSDGRFSLVFNGEIYNHAELRDDLIKKGYTYRSETDTETILYGFAEYGLDLLEKMTGMWAIAIWDDLNKELFCARDRIGIKPLYFYNQNGRFIFGSEIKSILQHPEAGAEMNINELPNYLNYGMSSNRNSLFKNIHKIPAGHFLKLSDDGDLHLKEWWSPITEDTEYTDLSTDEIATEVLSLLKISVKDRMMSDVPFGVFLSGGVDSSLNVALMSELMDRPVDTYSVGFRELEKYNELGYARQVADLFQTNHREILIDQDDCFGIIEDLPWHEDEPNGDPVCMPLYFLSKLTRDSGTVVIQVGEGSDEQFVGYPWMLQEYKFYNTYWKYYTSLPGAMKKATLTAARPFMRMMNQHLVLDYIRRGTEGDQLYWSSRSIFSPSHLELLLEKEHKFLSKIPAEYANSIHAQILKKKPMADYLQRIAYIELRQRLAELLLMRVDKIGMAHSIEARVPFLDHRLVEFTMTIPPEKKLPDGTTTKDILKKAVKGILPDEIIHRKKQGFWAPVNEWLRNEWHDYAVHEILTSAPVKDGILNREFISDMLQRHYTGAKNHGLEIYNLLMLALWHKKFIG